MTLPMRLAESVGLHGVRSVIQCDVTVRKSGNNTNFHFGTNIFTIK